MPLLTRPLRTPARIAMLVLALAGIAGCDGLLGGELHQQDLLSMDDFHRYQGHKLRYDIYLPSTYTSWVHSDSDRFVYHPESKTYVFDRIVIGQPEVDDLGTRFKISSLDWRQQFGFGHHGISLDESTFGLGKEGAILRLNHTPEGSSDMRVEYAERDLAEMRGKTLRFELKVLDDSSAPDALLLITLHQR